MAKKTETPAEFLPDFEGFGPGAFKFLRGLKRNNERPWFHQRKDTYENEVRFPMKCLAAEFARARMGDALPVHGDPGKSIFRIHRDTRFSHNKSPYKTHCGAVLSRSGGRGEQGIVYIHLEPRNCFVSAGFWRPEPALLTAWRNRVAGDPGEFQSLMRKLTDGAAHELVFRSISSLKTMPRGFSKHADTDYADYLRWKSFLITRPLDDAETRDHGMVDIVRDHAFRARPLLEYGWELMDAPRDRDPREYMAEG